MKRVVVTGIGIHTSIGKNKDECLDSIKNGVNIKRDIPKSRFDTGDAAYTNKGGHTLDDEVFLKLQNIDESVVTELSLQVIKEALNDSRLKEEDISGYRCGLSLGISTGISFPFIKWLQKRSNENLTDNDLLLILRSTPTITGDIACKLNIQGPCSIISTACTSGTISIGNAYEKILKGDVDYMIAGGVDLITILSFSGFNSLQNVSSDLCTPFDVNREGLVLGEGAGFVIIESYENAIKRGANIYAEISGYSYLNEAYHPTSPQPEGDYALYCMQKALERANKQVEQVTYINAHGTATSINDLMEYKAIKRLVGNNRVYISSTKSMTGHTLGAAGSIEFIITALGIKHKFIPPTINTKESLFKEDNLLFPNKAVEETIDVAISNSFGFGGNISSIVLTKIQH